MNGLQQLQCDASGSRLRGAQVARLESVVDAAFTCPLALLAIVAAASLAALHGIDPALAWLATGGCAAFGPWRRWCRERRRLALRENGA